MGRRSIIAKRLEQARKRAGISSQKALGVLAGIDEFGASARMNYYAKGTNQPKLPTITSIAAVLHTPVPYFYCEDDALAEVILKFGTLDEAQKRRLFDFLDGL
jgi:transcriptional regulator with XRE-family HTH domain